VFDVKAFVGFYVPVDFRLRPEDKPRPMSFPKNDPSAFLFPLFDSYAEPVRVVNLENPRLNPIIIDEAVLPPDVFFVAAGIDILLHEQLRFVQRIKDELEREGNTAQRIKVLAEERRFHGWLECKLLVFISLHLFSTSALIHPRGGAKARFRYGRHVHQEVHMRHEFRFQSDSS
jgi:hypothetical protein